MLFTDGWSLAFANLEQHPSSQEKREPAEDAFLSTLVVTETSTRRKYSLNLGDTSTACPAKVAPMRIACTHRASGRSEDRPSDCVCATLNAAFSTLEREFYFERLLRNSGQDVSAKS